MDKLLLIDDEADVQYYAEKINADDRFVCAP